jgi:pentatricopeptide repeat protein
LFRDVRRSTAIKTASSKSSIDVIYGCCLLAAERLYDIDTAYEILRDMTSYRIKPQLITYNRLIAACKVDGRHVDAVNLLDLMQKTHGLEPDTFTYTSAIAVCVSKKEWNLALDLLDRMEQGTHSLTYSPTHSLIYSLTHLQANIPRNRVTYNTAIEALECAGETIRSELVYQRAVKNGVYKHWVEDGSKEGQLVIDLHHFPLAVARAAIMDVLSDICTDSKLSDRDLIIITGRGKHTQIVAGADREKEGEERGVLRTALKKYLFTLGLTISAGDPNPGRIFLSKENIAEWIAVQKADDASKRENGQKRAHGNLFLQVAFAKQKKEGGLDVKSVMKVCPFSSAVTPTQEVIATHNAAAAEPAQAA